MIELTMWVLHRKGDCFRDEAGRIVFFDTRAQAVDYWQWNVLIGNNGWKPKKVRVTDAKP